jgi:hypothetical protein
MALSGEKTVAQGWKTTIGFCFVLLARKSPMVYGSVPFDPGRCPGLWYERLAAFLYCNHVRFVRLMAHQQSKTQISILFINHPDRPRKSF